MPCRIFYRQDSGALVSIGTVWTQETPPGTAFIDLADIPNLDSEMWDEGTRQFVARPAKVLVDRLDDLISDTNFSTVWSALNATRRTQLRNALIRLLGRQRYRAQSEQMEL